MALFAFAVPGADLPLGAKLAIGAALVLAEFVCYRGVVMGARAEDDALVITSLLTTRRVEWGDIDDFAVRGRATERKLVLVRTTGGEFSLGGIMPAVWAPNRDAVISSMEGTLRRWLRSARSSA